MIIPPTPEEIDKIVALGESDTIAWAREMGMVPAPMYPVTGTSA